jgi:hypothetical protein
LRTERSRRATTAARALRRHLWAYGFGGGALIAANWATGGRWWSFWPLAVWGVALGVHYLIYKSRTVDERWAEARTADLRSKSYDASHIDAIARDHGTDDPAAGKRK